MRDRGVDLDPFVHRPRMHHRRSGSHPLDPVGGEAPDARVLAKRRQEPGLLTLTLEPQRDHGIGRLECLIEIRLVRHARRKRSASPRRRDQGRRPRERDPSAERREGVDVRTRHAAVQDVADDDDALAVEIAERVAQGVGVEKALRRVGVPSVARVDHGGIGPLSDKVRSARRRMTHDDDVPAERLQGTNGVEQRLALLDGRPARRDVGDVGGERLRGELEGDASAGRCLGEEQDDRAPAQRRCATDRSSQYFGHGSGLIEHGLDLLPGPVIGIEDVTASPPHAGTRVTTSTSSRPSTSARCTRTSSPAAVGTFLPTKSARIGRSRCPRSTRTARRIARGRP